MPDAKVYVVENNVSVNVTETPVIVELGASGPQGPKGDPGLVLVDISYTHNQNVPSNTWTINHNLGFYPGITVVDSSGNVVEGSYTYQDMNTIIASFSGAFSGKAYLS